VEETLKSRKNSSAMTAHPIAANTIVCTDKKDLVVDSFLFNGLLLGQQYSNELQGDGSP
jgi:hypothetical protein